MLDWLLLCALSLQCFDAVGWAAGRASGLLKTEWWGAAVVKCLEQGADLHMAQLMPLPVSVSKIQIGFTFLVLTQPGSPGQRPLNRCVCVCVCVCFYVPLFGCASVLASVELCGLDQIRLID